MPATRRLVLEQLEDRITPACIWGIPWPDPGHLTLSFAPDGTQAGLGTSNLFQTLNAKAATSAWEVEILRAFQTWAVNSNINLSVVSDGGQALGTPGAIQGDSRFGDIRIAASAPGTGSTVDLANSQPFSWMGSTWAGDVVLNSSYPLGLGNVPGQYDLFSVMLHEAGHVFGFDVNTDPSSVMYLSYEVHSQLSASDIAALLALYGARQADLQGNNTLATAAPLTNSSQGATVSGDISSLSDADYYQLQTPGFLTGFSGFSVQVKTSGISLLEPSLAVYDAAGNIVSSAYSTDPLHGDVTFFVHASPSSTYYVRVSNATSSVFGIGSYQLNITNKYGLISLGNVVNTVTTLTNNTFGTAQRLLSQNPGNSLLPDYFVKGNLTGAANYYLVQSPPSASGSAENMVAMIWALDVGGLQSRLHVYDVARNPLSVKVVANDGGTYTIQLPGAQPNALYYVEVAAANPNTVLGSTGRYSLTVDFHQQQLVALDNLGSGSIANPTSGTLTTDREELFHFALTGISANANAWVMLTIVDQNGLTLATIKAQAGQPTVTANIYLKKGTFTINLSGYTSDGSAFGNTSFRLDGTAFSSPVGAYPTSPSSSPPPDSSPPPSSTSTSPSSPPPDYSYSSGSSSSSSPSSPYTY
jgi:hypothetical protein